ncbi:integrator complex subunit 1 [Ixodes scapularis]|uniref:integrator complex subunit 1 n=1 Tax=Ixodes scapularis TaxID=6945 RepID=UPI001C38829E|nr:integrator complex subunit 1 [Ixodes scapularis]
MEREKGKGSQKRGPNKVKALFPPGDFIALGSKQRATAADIPEPKPSAKSSSLSGASSSTDRKRNEGAGGSSSSTSSKKPKLAAAAPSSLARLGVPAPSQHVKREVPTKSDQWDVIAVEVDPTDFLSKVLKAEDLGDDDKVESIMCGAAKTLKNTRPKPDPMLYLTLMFLAKTRPRVFDSEVVVEAFSSLLKRDVSVNFKTKANNLTSVLTCNLLLAAFQDSVNWPEQFVKAFVEDSLGDRIWVDHDECKNFVDNVLTAFNTRLPPKSMLAPDLMFKPDACPSPPVQAMDDDDSLSSLHLDLKENPENIVVVPRFAGSQANIEHYILEVIQEQLTRRQPMDISKNLLRLLVCACGISEVRSLVAHRLETWLQNPKLTRPAQDLLLTVCMNCNQHNKHDVDVIVYLIRIRLKTKPVVNHFMQCAKELLGQHADNLSTVLKHCIYNELSNSRNPNNMQLLSVIFQHSPEKAAKVLAEVFQDLLINKDDYLRCLRALFREIIRSLRHDLNFTAFCLGLMQERKEAQFQEVDQTLKERLFVSLTDLIVKAIFLAITPAVREAATAFFRGEKKDISALRNYQMQVATIQRDTVWWLHTIVPKMFKPGRNEFIHCLHKTFFLEQLEHYCKDNWPPEGDRPLMLRLASDVPVLEDTLFRILVIGMSKEHPLNPSDALELVEQLVRRASAIYKEDSHPVLVVERTDLIEIIFHLCAYHHPENITLPSGYTPPNLAIADYYWKAWIMLLIVVAHNPSTFGEVAWGSHPTLRSMMEMCITNHFVFPPPTLAVGEKADEIKTREMQISQIEKQKILEFETHLAAASTKVTITESNSLLLSKLITMDPQGVTRRPPLQVLDQLKALNETHKLGHLLCRSRNPDFLLDIIQRQGTSHMPWLAELVESSEGSFDLLPVQCLCEFLLTDALECSQNGDLEEEKPEKGKGKAPQSKKRKQQQLLQHLQKLLRNPDEDVQATCEVLDYFMRRLSSQQQGARTLATKGLMVVLNQKAGITDAGQSTELNSHDWLLKDIPSLPHFGVVRHDVSATLRQACQVENDPFAITAYVKFLATYTPDEGLSELSLDITQLIIERPTIVNCILLQDTTSTIYSQLFHCSLLDIFTRYLQNARKPSKDVFWYECQDHITLQWPSGETATMHILVVHSMIILLTYGPPQTNPETFNALLETWFPKGGDPPQAFLVDTSEEALLLPDWLKLRMIRSSVDVLVDAALKDLDPSQLVLFIQSFGIPVPSMSKLLCCLDKAVEYDEDAVAQAVVDKAYMSQLVEVQHQRGAVGGERFYRLLGENDIGDGAMDADDIEPVPTSVIQHAPPRVTEASHLDSISGAVIQLFGLDPQKGKLVGKQEQELFRKLQKAFSHDVLRKCLFGGALAEFIHTCEHILENEHREVFVNALYAKSFISCSLFRLAIAAQQREASNSPLTFKFHWVCTKILELTKTASPLTAILKHYCTSHSSSRNKDQAPRRLTPADAKSANIVEALTSVALHESKRFEEALCVLVQRAIKIGDSQQLIHALSKILCENMFESEKVTTSFVIVDWLEHLEPECISSSPELQHQLLFQNSTNNQLLRTTFRPYLLALLIHRAHWTTLHMVINEILSPASIKKYDPSAVLDFLQACMFIPKIWQGRDKKIPKHYTPEKVLVFSPDQVCSMTDYILNEFLATATPAPKEESPTSTDKRLQISTRLPLLEQGCTDQLLVSSVVLHLMTITQNEPEHRTAAKEMLTQLYLFIPGIVFTSDAIAEVLKDIEPQTSGQTKVDTLSHTLLLALSIADYNKQAYYKLSDLHLAARKLAATHPELLLRQLPLMASLLHSRSGMGTLLFGSRNHASFFVHMLGILELLSPQLFSDTRAPTVDDIFNVYVDAFQSHMQFMRNHERERIMGLLNRFLLLIHQYLHTNPTAARRWIQVHHNSFQDVSSIFPDMMSLKTLLAGTCMVHLHSEGSEHAAEPGMEPGSGPRSSVPHPLGQSSGFSRSGGGRDLRRLLDRDSTDPEEILSALKDLEAVSAKKPDVLEAYQDELQCVVLTSSNTSCCSLAFKLLLLSIRNNPKTAGQFISGYLQCLASERRDLVLMALDRLPEFVVLAEEHGSMLLQKAFQVGISTNVNSAVPITETLLLLNMQYGN